jgi:hypothetical protein
VELPQQFEDAILESISVKQNITRTLKTKNNMEVQFATQIMASKQMANQTGTRRGWLPWLHGGCGRLMTVCVKLRECVKNGCGCSVMHAVLLLALPPSPACQQPCSRWLALTVGCNERCCAALLQ